MKRQTLVPVANDQLDTQQDNVTSFSSTCDQAEHGKVEPGSSNESVTNKEDETGTVVTGSSLKDIDGEVEDLFTSRADDVMVYIISIILQSYACLYLVPPWYLLQLQKRYLK